MKCHLFDKNWSNNSIKITVIISDSWKVVKLLSSIGFTLIMPSKFSIKELVRAINGSYKHG